MSVIVLRHALTFALSVAVTLAAQHGLNVCGLIGCQCKGKVEVVGKAEPGTVCRCCSACDQSKCPCVKK